MIRQPKPAAAARRAAAPLSAALVLGLLAACASPPLPAPADTIATAAPAPAPAPARSAPPSANAGAVAGDSGSRSATLQMSRPAPALPGAAGVLFAFDDYTVGSQYFPLIERFGRYLAAQPSATVRVEGSADERGSHEYNLALGQKRAEAVAKVLRSFGVRDNQMEVVSFGEERPHASGHGEAAWSQNRRADLRAAARP